MHIRFAYSHLACICGVFRLGPVTFFFPATCHGLPFWAGSDFACESVATKEYRVPICLLARIGTACNLVFGPIKCCSKESNEDNAVAGLPGSLLKPVSPVHIPVLVASRDDGARRPAAVSPLDPEVGIA